MRTLPQSRAGRIEFFRLHLQQWLTEGEQIGLDAGQLAALGAQLEAAEAALADAEAARSAARSATIRFHTAEDRLTETGRAAIATIKAQAARTHDPLVYARAQLDAPAPPSPTPAPAAPRWKRAWIDSFGRVHLSWEADAAGPRSGVYFTLLRRDTMQAPWRTLDAVQQTSFIDHHPPVLTPGKAISYALIARRGLKRSATIATTTITAAAPETAGTQLQGAAA